MGDHAAVLSRRCKCSTRRTSSADAAAATTALTQPINTSDPPPSRRSCDAQERHTGDEYQALTLLRACCHSNAQPGLQCVERDTRFDCRQLHSSISYARRADAKGEGARLWWPRTAAVDSCEGTTTGITKAGPVRRKPIPSRRIPRRHRRFGTDLPLPSVSSCVAYCSRCGTGRHGPGNARRAAKLSAQPKGG